MNKDKIFLSYLIMTFFIINSKYVNSQCETERFEKIANGGFESGEINYPTNLAQFGKVSKWKDNMKEILDQYGNYHYLHSPEWFKNEYGMYFLSVVINGEEKEIEAYKGKCYAGMGNGELIQQKVSEKFEENKPYLVSIAINPIVSAAGTYYPNDFRELKFRVYVAKQDI